MGAVLGLALDLALLGRLRFRRFFFFGDEDGVVSVAPILVSNLC